MEDKFACLGTHICDELGDEFLLQCIPQRSLRPEQKLLYSALLRFAPAHLKKKLDAYPEQAMDLADATHCEDQLWSELLEELDSHAAKDKSLKEVFGSEQALYFENLTHLCQ